MKYDEPNRTLELTERNVLALLAKLEDALSARTLTKDGFTVTAVWSREGVRRMPDTAYLDKDGLERIQQGQMLDVDGVFVVMVPDEAHYSDRAPGPVYMPSEGRLY